MSPATTAAKKPRAPRQSAAATLTAPPSPYTPAGMLDWNPQWEQFGGDCVALAAYNERSGVPFSKERVANENFPSLQQKGVLIHRTSPTLVFNWFWHETDGTRHTEFVVGNTLRGKGYRAATVEEFALNPNLRGSISVDNTGRYVVTDMRGKTMATVMVRGRDAWLSDRKEQLKYSDFIQGAAEEKADAITEKLRQAGINAKTTFTMEDVDTFQPDTGENL